MRPCHAKIRDITYELSSVTAVETKVKNKVCLIYTTYPDYNTAYKVSSALLREGLIACVNVFPETTSMYLWNGSLDTNKEHVTIMKTLEIFAAKVQHRIKESHPYTTPAILSIVTQDCDQGFLDWVNKSLKTDDS